ncbi:MAG: alanine racemase, partial [Mycobacterium sp.]
EASDVRDLPRRLLRADAEVPNAEVPNPQWHMVGHIQRNKARSVARWAHTVQSVDSVRLVTALEREVSAALAEGHRAEPLRVYVEVSFDGDASRGGVDISTPAAVDQVCEQVAGSTTLEFVGLMGVPPRDWDPGEAFARLQSEHRRVLESHPGAVGLSAGMSNDFEIAVKHGSTCVRVGTALLGPRPLPSPY